MGFRNLLLLFALAAIWGASFLFIKIAVAEVSPLALATSRVELGSLGLVAYAATTRLRFPPLTGGPGRPMWQSCLFLGAFGGVFPYLLINWSELHIASAAAAILNATSPLFSSLFGHVLGRWGSEERLTSGRAAGLLLGLVGVAVLVGGSEGAQRIGSGGALEVAGYLAVVAASASYAVGGLFARLAFAGMSPVVPAIGQNLGGAVLLLPIGLTVGRPAAWPSAEVMGSMLALGLGGTAFAYLIYYRLIANVGATRTLAVTYLLPVTAIGYGAVLLGETLTPWMLAGLALILAGVGLTTGSVRLGRRGG